MRKSFFVFCPLLLAGTFLVMENAVSNNSTYSVRTLQEKDLIAIGCAPGLTDVKPDAEGKFIRIMPGWGNHSYTISTKSDSAQVYFNQGLTMYYSYHSREAVASFREAAKFDSTNAMVYWGQALAMGPSYNYGYMYKMNPAVPAVLEKMNRYAGNATEKEKALLEAMNKRYKTEDTADKDRKALNIAYAQAMEPLVAKFSNDIDIKALYTDAVMLIHPWEFWNNDGTPKQWTQQLVRYCEEILSRNPQHPGALHYYIHVTEASRSPEVALSSADSLLKLFPGIAHMVHMSSHEYERIGFYAKGVVANELADQSLGIYDSLAKSLSLPAHVPHYFAVDAYCAMSGAMYKKGIQKSMNTRKSVKPDKGNLYAQYQYMFPELAMVRMGKWQDILDDKTVVDADWSYAGILYDFAKGMANAKTGNLPEAENHLAQLKRKMSDVKLKEKFAPHASSPYEVSLVAENILLATIHFGAKKYPEAITAIKKAIEAEDNLLYAEPNLWMIPARQYLGSYLLQQNKTAEAEAVYRQDLTLNPGNGWSTLGLYQALKAQGKNGELDKLKKRYLYSFSEAEQVPAMSAY